jgi:hypothetical protein
VTDAHLSATKIVIISKSTKEKRKKVEVNDKKNADFRTIVLIHKDFSGTSYLQTWSFGHGQNGHFRFRERGHCSLYINIKYLYIVADFDFPFSILTK